MAKKGSKKQPKAQAAQTVSETQPRVKKLNRKQRRLAAKTEAKSRRALPSGFKLIKQTCQFIWSNKRILGLILLVYLILDVAIASGLSNLSERVDQVKQAANDNTVHGSHLAKAFNAFGSLIGSAGGSASSSTLQIALLLLESLVIIWALRHLMAGKQIGVKQAYYQSMTPLVPFLIVLSWILINMIPFLLGGGLIEALYYNNLAVAPAIGFLAWFIFFLGAAWSIYLLSASIFSIYIVTLPDMMPRNALRSAKNLVRFRRWSIIRKLLLLPIFIWLVIGLIVVPLIIWATFLVVPVFFVLGIISILFIHTYLYSLYRGMLE